LKFKPKKNNTTLSKGKNSILAIAVYYMYVYYSF